MNKIFLLLFPIVLIHLCSCQGSTTNKSVAGTNASETIIPGAWQTEEYFPLLTGKRIALVGNHSSLIDGVHLADSLLSAGFDLIKVFSPEHGFRGQAAAGEHVQSGKDTRTGLPVISLYGSHRRPSPDELNDLDIIIFDIQDVGTRFYTYISTMTYMMEEAAKQNILMLILDRPNPNGHFIDGPIMEKKHTSFVGLHPIPVVHGMTVAEYARMVNGEGWLASGLVCDLIIVPVKNYKRTMWYELPVAPSPNLPNMTSIVLYPGICFFEGTVLSLGRGTDFPFQVFGHPQLPQDIYTFTFTPESLPAAPNPPQMNRLCYGIDFRTSNPKDIFRQAAINLDYLIDAYHHFPNKQNFFNDYFEKLSGTDHLRRQIMSGLTFTEIKESWQPGLIKFREIRKPYLIYPDQE